MKQMSLIEMDGFLKGKCIPCDLKVNETNAEYLVRKFGELESKLETALRECRSAGITIDNLEAKCAALDADNEKAMEAMRQADEVVKRAHSKFAALTDENMALRSAIENGMAAPETPATDAFLAEVRAQGVKSLSNAVQSVIAERQRHQSAEGWTPEHDDQYSKSQLLWASSCYVLNAIHPFNRIPFDWPWTPEWWKPTNPRRDLVKAGALILAEIERIDRQEAAQ
ncbi:hypothetical protein [Escherichia coli]|jgi:hypothetical protein|uniref:hypothetical protein n=1 Tax=Escherichia coli TaxID=562 RepID=UPI003D17616E